MRRNRIPQNQDSKFVMNRIGGNLFRIVERSGNKFQGPTVRIESIGKIVCWADCALDAERAAHVKDWAKRCGYLLCWVRVKKA